MHNVPKNAVFSPVFFSPAFAQSLARVCEGETVRGDPRFETASLNQTRPLKDRERERELEGMTVVAVGVVVDSTVKWRTGVMVACVCSHCSHCIFKV